MKTMLCFLFIDLLLSSPLALASNWQLIDSDTKASVFIDTPSITGPYSARVAWFLVDYSKPLSSDVYFLSTEELLAFDCANKTWYEEEILYYSDKHGTGKLLHTDLQPSPLRHITPDSFGETEFNTVCAHKAAKWQLIGSDTDQSRSLSLDIASINGPFSARSVWFLINYRTPQPFNGLHGVYYLSTKALVVFDCANKTSSKKQMIDYSDKDGAGEVIDSYSGLSPFEHIALPLGETLFNVVCHS